MTVPASWMPAADMQRIHVHWTAGGHRANATDKRAYHILIEADGNLVRGERSIKANQRGSGMTPASHTLNANSGAIGISMCCMVGAVESPFKAGSAPMTETQWDKMIEVAADLAKRYRIPVTPVTILTHAEVQPNLNIPQRNKWDITRLAFDSSIRGHRPIGDRMRREIAAALDGAETEDTPTGNKLPKEMKPPHFRVVGVKPSTLNFRDAPNGTKKGALPENTIVEKLSESGNWWQVRTRGGFVGWVFSSFLQPSDR
jgi:hypothetical protein